MRPKQIVLPLRLNVLDNPLPLDIDVLGAMMLWPDDELRRIQALDASIVDRGRRDLSKLDPADLSKLDPAAIASLIELSAESFPVSHLLEEDVLKEGRSVRGMLAGNALHDIVAAFDAGRDTTFGEVVELCIAHFTPEAHDKVIKKKPDAIALSALITPYYPKWKISKKTFDIKVWRVFRSVAHFWSAALIAAKFENEFVFPCRPERLAQFLADAEFYRVRGESIRAKQAPSTVLRSGEAVLLPPEFRIEPSELHFHFP